MHETRVLAEYVARTKFDDLPAEVVGRAKQLLLDHFGVALLSTRTEWGRIALKYAKEFAAVDECTVYGQPWKSSAQHAALANGLCAHGYELDDSYEGGFCHPGAPTIPAALAAVEKKHGSGRDLLLSMVMGYEIMGRISRALGRESNKVHHATGQVGVFGATAAAGKAMGLDQERLTNALGLAGCMASGLMEFTEDPKGTMVKRLYGGWPSQSGVAAAWLAGEGYTGPSSIVEGRFGFLRSISPNYDLSAVTAGLGQDYQLMHTVFKPYASCRAFHPMVEGIAELREVHGLTADNVERLDVGVRESIMRQQVIYQPESMMSAQYSMPFTAALALYRDLADPDCYEGDVVSDPAVLATARKVHAHLDPEIDGYPRYAARIKAQFKNGRTITVDAWDHRGTEQKPFSNEDVIAKFEMMTATILPSSAARRIIEATAALDSDTSDAIQELGRALRNGD
jgi:2-methylcitrate dehydratase PrpD